MHKYLLPILFSLVFLSSCTDEDEPNNNDVVAPTSYSFERDGVSTVSFSGQTDRILMATELINAMNDFDQTTETMLEMYANQTATGDDATPFSDAALNVSSKSVRSKTAASRDFFSSNTVEASEVKQYFENLISAQVSEVFPNQNELASPGIAGQIADGSSVRYVNTKGLEYNQAVNKGLIGALMVDQMLNNYLGTSVLDEADNRANNDANIVDGENSYTTMEHKWDEAFGYLFGTATDESNPLATLGEDSFLNKYVARVNGDDDFNTVAQEIYDALKLGRAAIVAKNYDVRDEQAAIIREKVSEVIAIRAVYYLQQGKNQIPTEGLAYGPTFHDLSEGHGFVYSLRFTRNPETNTTYFTRSEVDGFLAQLEAGNGFWDVTPETLDSISEAIAAKFDFTVAQAAE